jgi:hypothetical protein
MTSPVSHASLDSVTLDRNRPAVHLTFKTTHQQADAITGLADVWGCSRSDAIRYGLSLATDPVALGAAVAVALAEQASSNATPGVDRLTGTPFDAGMTP